VAEKGLRPFFFSINYSGIYNIIIKEYHNMNDEYLKSIASSLQRLVELMENKERREINERKKNKPSKDKKA